MAMAMELNYVGKKDHLQVNSVGHNVLKLHELQDEAERRIVGYDLLQQIRGKKPENYLTNNKCFMNTCKILDKCEE